METSNKANSMGTHLLGALEGSLASVIVIFIGSGFPLENCNCNECGNVYWVCLHYWIILFWFPISFILGAIGGFLGSVIGEKAFGERVDKNIAKLIGAVFVGIITGVIGGYLILSAMF